MTDSARGCSLLVLFSLLILTTAIARAQTQTMDVNRSTGAPGSIYHGSDIDNVNLSSGNLRITIPLLHFPGRGLDTDIVLTYNSKIWKTATFTDVTGFTRATATIDLDTNTSPATGWGLGIPRLGHAGNSWNYCVIPDSSGGCIASYAYYTWVTNDGTRTTLVSEGVY